MIKTNWSMSTWIKFIGPVIIGVIGVYLRQNMRMNTRKDAITEENIDQKILLTMLTIVVLYIVPTDFGVFEIVTGKKIKMSNTFNLSLDTLLLMGLSTFIIWMPRD